MEIEDFFFIGFFILFLIMLNSVISGIDLSEDPIDSLDCIDNQTKSCFVGPCMGNQTCTDGKWSRCSWEIVCKPNSVAPCEGSLCAGFIRTCNVCGTGYGPCVESGKES